MAPDLSSTRNHSQALSRASFGPDGSTLTYMMPRRASRKGNSTYTSSDKHSLQTHERPVCSCKLDSSTAARPTPAYSSEQI